MPNPKERITKEAERLMALGLSTLTKDELEHIGSALIEAVNEPEATRRMRFNAMASLVIERGSRCEKSGRLP